MLQSRPLKVGTRGSPLALAQAHEVRARLMKAHDLNEADVEIVVISTSGDQILDKSLREVGGKGLFTKEIEEALLREDIDLAVHSMKDVETELPPGLVLDAILPREDVRDAFISLQANSFQDLPEGSVVGTSSLRRRAQVKALRPDLQVVEFRGNVQTRLKKLEDGVADATLLACAGLNRLGMVDKITRAIEADEMLPAVAQGAIGLEIRDGDTEVSAFLDPLNDEQTSLCVRTERAFLRALDGSCRTPIAGLAEFAGPDAIRFRGMILTPDGRDMHHRAVEGRPEEIEEKAREAGETLRSLAGPEFFDMC